MTPPTMANSIARHLRIPLLSSAMTGTRTSGMNFDPEAVRAFEHAGWQRVAGAYDATFARATVPFVATLLDAGGVTSGMRVLDLCCGTGVVAAGAAKRGAAVTGLDFSSAMLSEARRANPRLAFDQGDTEAMPYLDGSFDAVVD